MHCDVPYFALLTFVIQKIGCSSEDSPPVSLEIVDVEKRKGLTKYYVS